jgi:tRNA A-37 threonylcarbamoyl transferase component Bud32
MSGPGKRPTPEPDHAALAAAAERAGDMAGATAALRVLVDRQPGDARLTLRLSRALVATGERPAARRLLAALAEPAPPEALARDVHRALAELDEADGDLASALDHWERILADDIDDPEARARVRALGPQAGPSAAGAAETLVSPEGVEALRYRLRRELGRGATAAVYLAADETLGIDVALKVLHPQLAGAARADARRRFFSEGRVAAAVRHPGVIAIYDLDEDARVLTMEYVPGGTLRARLASHAGAAASAAWRDEIVTTAAALLGALAHVHERGIAHGDLKPSNVLLRAPGAPVLADFGAAELRDAATASGGAAGTPQYLAPERLRGARPSAAADVYAAGAVLWEMTAGRPLRTHAELMRGATDVAPLPPEARALLGAPLAALVEALLAPDAPARPTARAALQSLG